MKITFLKKHDIYSVGDAADVPDGLGNYLIRCLVAEQAKPKKEKKVIEPKLEKK